jgi:glycerol-1-phosphate dehydrogenase [NAD(P)+]
MNYDPTRLDDLKSELAKRPENLTEIGIKDIFIGAGLRNEVSKFIPRGSKVLLVTGDTPMFVGDEKIKETIENNLNRDFEDLKKLVFHNPHADFENAGKVKAMLEPETVVVSVGSGTITDICKHACYIFEKETGCEPLRFVVVQTANTVTAFTSNIAVLLKDGVKRTYPSRYPDYVISDTEILRDAPYKLTQAGFGDLIARYVSYPDWYLGYSVKNLAIYNEVPKELLDDSLEWLVQNADKVAKRDSEAMEILTKTLHNAGISMSIVGMSTPISGYEHVISHILDMKAGIDGRETELHGIQVGVASVISAYIYEELLAINELDLKFPEWLKIENQIRENFSKVGFDNNSISEIISDYKIKYEKWIANHDEILKWAAGWSQEKSKIFKLLKTGDELKLSLQKIGIPIKLDEDWKFAFKNAHFIRRRFTVADLLYFMGKLNNDLYSRVTGRIRGE